MGSFSKVVLLGNLTRDPSTGTLPSGTAVCEFGLAVNRRWKDAKGQKRDEVLFMDCAAYGKPGQTMGQYLKKGNPVLVEGHLKLDRWDDDQGQAHSRIRTIVERFQFISRGDGQNGSSNGSTNGQNGNQPGKVNSTAKRKRATANVPVAPAAVSQETAPF